jgi:hypothetical protein
MNQEINAPQTVYIVMEKSNGISFLDNNFRIIGATYKYEDAVKLIALNRIIMGPVPIFKFENIQPFFNKCTNCLNTDQYTYNKYPNNNFENIFDSKMDIDE